MKRVGCAVIFLLMTAAMNAQDSEERFPYREIPDYPDTYTPGTVVARMIDGLGYRYYWATQGLTEKDLAYRVSDGSRSVEELLYHVHGLSEVVLNTAAKQPVDRREPRERIQEAESLREQTLKNLKTASALMAESTDLSEHPLIFVTDKNSSRFPFWNQINGPIEDAVWHSGQIAMMRRANGNPIAPGVDVFLGVTKK